MERPGFFLDLLRHVDFTAADTALLARALPDEAALERVVERFYEDLLAHEETRRVVTGEEQVARMRCTLRDWLVSIFVGPHDEAYFERRCRIGRRHVQIGLEQHSMFTAMAVIRDALGTALDEALRDRPERLRTIRALHKILDVELAVMVETYSEERFEIDVLRESERTYRDLIENAPELILTVDRAGRIQHINRTALDLLGFATGPAPGRLVDLVVPADRDRVWAAVRPVFDDGADVEFETRFLERTGAERDVVAKVAGLAPSSPRAEPSVRIFVQDVTEARRLARQVEEKRRLAAIGQMVAGIAHEIRTPLQVITTGVDALVQANRSPGLEREVARAQEGLRRVRGFIQEILDYSKEIHLDRMEVEPATLVGSALSDLTEDIERAGIAVSTRFHPAAGRILADPFRIKQVLVNLLQNAIEAVPPGGSIRISACPLPGRSAVEFVVADDGRGIAEADRSRIFVPFFTTKPRGTGLGLPIVERIVHAHGGRIDVESRPGRGTEIRFSIPVQPERPPCPANAS